MKQSKQITRDIYLIEDWQEDGIVIYPASKFKFEKFWTIPVRYAIPQLGFVIRTIYPSEYRMTLKAAKAEVERRRAQVIKEILDDAEFIKRLEIKVSRCKDLPKELPIK